MKMKRNITSLCALVSASAVLIVPVLSENRTKISPEEPKIELDEKQQIAYHAAIHEQVLRHFNKEVPIPNRFSRVLRPMPGQYYSSEIVSKSEDGIVEFNVVFIDRMKLGKQQPTVIANGQFKSETGEVLLKDKESGNYLPASEHPLINKKPIS